MNPWQGIHEFISVADTQSFTQAASLLGISTAQVSRQVSQLEQRIGSKLFYRTTRKVTLTEAGKVYYQSCHPLLEALEDAERAVNQLESSPKGLIRLTAPMTYGERHIAPLLNEFMQQHPEIRIQCELTNQKLDLIDHQLDIAIRIGKIETPNLVAKRLGKRHLHTCASPEYLEANGTPQTLGDLTKHQCLIGTLDYWRFRDNQGEERLLKLQGRMRCNSGSALLDAALRGLGIVQIPCQYVLPSIKAGTLVRVLDDYAPADEDIWALYPQGRQMSPKIKILLEWLQQKLV